MSTQKIAVIGSGISGLGSAFILSGKHRVDLFEKDKKFGGHSNTITINKEEQQFKVDTGFIVYNDNNYPNFSKLLSHLKISSKLSDMSLGFSFNDRNFEYACDNLDKLFAQRKNLLNYNYILQHYRLCQHLISQDRLRPVPAAFLLIQMMIHPCN